MGVCLVGECGRDTGNRVGICEGHYARRRRTGRMDARPIKPKRLPTECQEPDCHARARSMGWCHKHYTRWQRHGDPSVRLPTGSPAGPDNPTRKAVPGYGPAHRRIARLRGQPSRCERCGLAALDASYQWALRPEARAAAIPSKDGPYSLDPMDYLRLCLVCHRRMDLEATRRSA